MHGRARTSAAAVALTVTWISVNESPAAAERAGPVPIEQIAVDDLLDRAAHSGDSGGFGAVLERAGSRPYVHGIVSVSVSLDSEAGEFSKDSLSVGVEEFDVFVGAILFERLQPELKLDIGMDELQPEIAQLDIIISDSLIVRSGLFLVPIGAYNENHYPEYTALLPREGITQVHSLLIPVEWSALGVQLRGRRALSSGYDAHYAAFFATQDRTEVSMGQDKDDPPETDAETELRAGARLGIEGRELSADLSAYYGPHPSVDADAMLLVADAAWERFPWTARTEFVYISRDRITGKEDQGVTSWGSHTRVGYRVAPWLQPAMGVEVYDTSDATSGSAIQLVESLNLTPYFEEGGNVVLRAAAYQRFDGDLPDHEFGVLGQVALGF